MLTSSHILWRILKTLNRTPIRLIVFATLLNVALVATDFAPERIEPKGPQQSSEERQRSDYNKTDQAGFWPTVFSRVSDFSTVFIAGFNGLLVYVTYKLVMTTSRLWTASTEQGRLAQEAINLARNEFNSTHRPKIRIKHLWLETDIWQEEPIVVTLECINTGPVDAFLNEVGIAINVVKNIQRPNEIGPRLTGHGERMHSGVNSQFLGIKLGDLTPEDSRAIVQGVAKLYCLGYISYRDAAERIRITGFCRVLTFPPDALPLKGNCRFRVVDDPDYEYED